VFTSKAAAIVKIAVRNAESASAESARGDVDDLSARVARDGAGVIDATLD
jgi:hypothetical protein